MKLNIVLIKPPNTYNLNPKEQQGLGILYIASILKKENNVKLLDLSDKTINESIKIIPKADIYGFTATFLDLNISHKLAKKIKLKYPTSKIIIGGFGPTASPNLINKNLFDSIIIGEGELTIKDFIKDFKQNNIKKIYSKKFLSEKQLNSLPLPSRDLLDYKGGKIFNFGIEYTKGQSTGIVTSRGCPYNCSFCASCSLWDQKIRFRNIDKVITEIEYVIKRYKIFNFKIQDDTFIINEKRVIDFCKKMINLNKKYNNKISWRCYGGRVDLITENMLKYMKKSGCKEIDYGIETGDQKILNLMQKKTNIKQAINAIKITKKNGIDTRAFIMVGLPGTTKKTAEKDIDFLKKAKPDAVNLAIFNPYPGSDIYNKPDKYNISFDKPKNYKELYKFDKYNMHLFSRDKKKSSKSIIKIKNISNESLEKIKQKVIDYLINNKLLHIIKNKSNNK
jgi:anaerobic magnesium-protoporphyrin IX monomethyl ester cyclase